MITVVQRYSYLACGPRVTCRVCGKTGTSAIQEGGTPYTSSLGSPPYEWSLHCGECRSFFMTTVFEVLTNGMFKSSTAKSRQRYENNRKKVVQWLLAGWPETQERLRTNNLIAGGAWKHKRHLAYLKRQFPELLHVTGAES